MKKPAKPTPFFKVRLKSKTTTIRHQSAVYEAPSSGKEIGRLVDRARSIRQQLDEVKPLYNELDQITLALMNAQDMVRKYGQKHGVELVDNFADKNTQFRVASIRRFELKWKM